jgi:hypothetical protein
MDITCASIDYFYLFLTMSRTTVRFEFQCENERLRYTHDIDSRLVGPLSANPNQHYQKQFLSTIHPIINQHYAACLAASGRKCNSCTKPTAAVLTSPMSWLHHSADPFVNVLVTPVCESGGRCEMQARNEIQKMMEDVGTGDQGELLACKVCAKVEGAQRCARCRAVSYCGKDCQKADWKAHKVGCRKLDSA